MKRIIPNANLPQQPPKIEDPPLSDISVDKLIGDGLLSLHREMQNLKYLSARGKLDAPHARDLRDTVKLLFELKDREGTTLKGMTDEQINALAKAVLAQQEGLNGQDPKL